HLGSRIDACDLTFVSDTSGNAERRLTGSRSNIENVRAAGDLRLGNESLSNGGKHDPDDVPILFPIRRRLPPSVVVVFHGYSNSFLIRAAPDARMKSRPSLLQRPMPRASGCRRGRRRRRILPANWSRADKADGGVANAQPRDRPARDPGPS